MEKERIIQEFVPGKQVTLAHLIAHPGAELAKKIGVPESGAIGIMTLTPGETAMIAGDLAMKAADVHIGFLDRFSGALVIYGLVRKLVGLRLSQEEEFDGADLSIHKISATPDREVSW